MLVANDPLSFPCNGLVKFNVARAQTAVLNEEGDDKLGFFCTNQHPTDIENILAPRLSSKVYCT